MEAEFLGALSARPSWATTVSKFQSATYAVLWAIIFSERTSSRIMLVLVAEVAQQADGRHLVTLTDRIPQHADARMVTQERVDLRDAHDRERAVRAINPVLYAWGTNNLPVWLSEAEREAYLDVESSV